jgi:hypothetical protein
MGFADVVAAGAAKAGRARAKEERITEVFILVSVVECSDESVVMIEMMGRSSKTLIYPSKDVLIYSDDTDVTYLCTYNHGDLHCIRRSF